MRYNLLLQKHHFLDVLNTVMLPLVAVVLKRSYQYFFGAHGIIIEDLHHKTETMSSETRSK